MLEVGAGGAVMRLRRGARLAPRFLGRCAAGVVRAAFVPTQAGPLAGDEDRARIVVGAGASLIVEPVAATLALPGAARTLLELEIVVEAGGRLVFDEAPLIVAFGAHVTRRCRVTLGEGAIAAVRDTVILGRDCEPPGTIDSTMRAMLGGRPLLHDGLRLGPTGEDAFVALPPGHRVVSTISLLGVRPSPDDDAWALAATGALRRASGTSLASVESVLDELWSRWSHRTASMRNDRWESAPAPRATTTAL